MRNSKIAGVLVVIAALAAVLVVSVWPVHEVQAAREQAVTRPDRYVSVSAVDGVFVRMNEFGKVEVYDWAGNFGALRGFPTQQWVTAP